MIDIKSQDFNAPIGNQVTTVDMKGDIIKDVSVSYDGGRFSVYVNGEEVIKQYMSIDFNVEIKC